MGRPAKKRNETDGKVVEALAAFGVPQESIAGHVGMSVPTLVKLYRAELKKGKSTGDVKLMETAFSKATKDRDTAMIIFLLKTRLHMSETGKADGVPDKSKRLADSLREAFNSVGHVSC